MEEGLKGPHLEEEQTSFLRRALENCAAFLFFIRTGGTTSSWAVRREVYLFGLVGGIPAHGRGIGTK